MDNQKGFIKLILIIIIVIVILGFFGISIRSFVNNSVIKDNFRYLWEKIKGVPEGIPKVDFNPASNQ